MLLLFVVVVVVFRFVAVVAVLLLFVFVCFWSGWPCCVVWFCLSSVFWLLCGFGLFGVCLRGVCLVVPWCCFSLLGPLFVVCVCCALSVFSGLFWVPRFALCACGVCFGVCLGVRSSPRLASCVGCLGPSLVGLSLRVRGPSVLSPLGGSALGGDRSRKMISV